MSPQILYIGAPFVIAAVCDWLQHDGLPERTNALIVIATTISLSTLWALLNGQLFGSLAADAGVVTVGSLFILDLPQLALIHAWLQRLLTSPFSVFAPTPPTISAATQPTAPIAVRASTLAPGERWRPMTTPSGGEAQQSAVPPSQADEAEQTPPPSAQGDPRG